MGCEIGRLRPTNVFERAGESRMTPPASSSSSQVLPGVVVVLLRALMQRASDDSCNNAQLTPQSARGG